MRISQRADITVSSYVYLNNPNRFHFDPHRQQSRSISTAYLRTSSSDVCSSGTFLFSGGSDVFAGGALFLTNRKEIYNADLRADSTYLLAKDNEHNHVRFTITLRQYTVYTITLRQYTV
jgi:hypothetical protein